jgi:hypothetical protein
MMHLGKICSVGNTPPHSALSARVFLTQQYTSLLLTISDLISKLPCPPKTEKDASYKKDPLPRLDEYYNHIPVTNSTTLLLNSFTITRASLPRELIQGAV